MPLPLMCTRNYQPQENTVPDSGIQSNDAIIGQESEVGDHTERTIANAGGEV